MLSLDLGIKTDRAGSVENFAMSRFTYEKFGPVIVRDELLYRKELRLMENFRADFEAVGLSQDGVRFENVL